MFVVVVALGLLIGDVDGFTIGVELGFAVGVPGVPFAVVVELLGLTMGLDVGFGFGLEFGFGTGVVVTGVAVVAAALIELPDVLGLFVAAAGLVPAGVDVDDEALFELGELFEVVGELPLAGAVPPPFD